MIRMAALSDAQRFAEIYNPYIETTMVTFEEEPLSREQFEKRMEGIMEQYPWIVYEEEGRVLGYAYLSAFNPRSAYDWTADLAIYVDMQEKGKGIGSKLMRTIIELAKKDDYLIKLIAEVSPDNLQVSPRLVKRGSSYDVSGTLNMATIKTDLADEVSVIGLGAGSLETASAMLTDLISILKNKN